MSDVAPQGAETVAPAGEAPAETNVDWEARYRAEVQERVAERERYKPVASAFQNLHPDDARAIQDFVKAYANGDTETATRWMVDNAKTLAGDNFQQYIAGQQAVVNHTVAQGQAAGLTPEAVQELVSQQIAAFQEQQEIANCAVEIDQELRDLGLVPDTPLAHAIITQALNRDDLNLRAAYSEMENQILQQAQSIVERRRSASSAMPTAAPNGINGVPTSGSLPRDRAMARLEQQGL